MELDAIFHRKEPQFESQSCLVECIVELDADAYWNFRSNMLQDQDFIAENKDLMCAENGTVHCLLVLGEGCDEGVLVNSEGSDYARYAAFVPGARLILMAEEQRAEQDFMEQICEIDGTDTRSSRVWLEHIRELAESDILEYGAAAHDEYCHRLKEFGMAFQRADRLHAGASAEIFNSEAFCRPEELLPAADWISNGGDAEDLDEYIQRGAFQLKEISPGPAMPMGGIA